jgi:4-amino-4-deoxy-L-arabinose transferase-like glycosyltransferase
MFQRLHHRGCHYLLLLTLGAALFLTNLGKPSLWDIDEGRNLTCSYEMREAGNWVIPTFNSKLRPDKPVLLYWLQMLAYECFGINEFAGRLPSALAALGTVLLCYELGRSMFSAAAGLLGGIIVATTPMLCGAAHFANPDALLNLCVILTLVVFWWGYERPTVGWFAGLGAAQGLGMLAKGPVAVVLPTGIIVAFLLWERRWWTLVDWRQLAAVLSFIVVAAPWYALVSAETKGEFATEFFLKHNRDRALTPMENHAGGLWYYPVILVVGTIPWSIFLLPAMWDTIRSSFQGERRGVSPTWPVSKVRTILAELRRAIEGGEPVPMQLVHLDELDAMLGGSDTDVVHVGLTPRRAPHRLLLCWVVVWIACFTVAATKLPNYVLPAVAPLALITGQWLQRWRLGELRLPTWLMPGAVACLAFVGIVLGGGLLLASGVLPWDLTRGRSFPELAPWALLGLLPIGGGAAAAGCLWKGQRTGVVVSVAVSALLLFVPLWGWAVPLLNAHKSPQPLAMLSEADDREHDVRIVAWQVDHLPSLNFYARRHVDYCENESQVIAFMEYPLPVYAFLPAAEWEALRPKLTVPYRELGRHDDLYRRVPTVVVTNR